MACGAVGDVQGREQVPRPVAAPRRWAGPASMGSRATLSVTSRKGIR